MIFYPPFPAPFSSSTYLTHSGYDVTNAEPTQWRLRIAVTSGTAVKLKAACPGVLSTVPHWHMREEGLANLRLADGDVPAMVTLYLQPTAWGLAEINAKLKNNGLGDELRCFVYRNVATSTLGPAVKKAVSDFGTYVKSVSSPAAVAALEHFIEGEFSVFVGSDVLLGEATAGIEAEFGILTSTGYVDPATFFDVMSVPHTSDVDAFVTFFKSAWPILGNAAAVLTASASRLYPAPVLYEAKRRLTPTQWGAVGILQQQQYWQRLLVSSGASPTGPSFTFNTDDMFNPFQVAAVVEFYLAWPEPARGGSPPANFPALAQRQVDLSSGWHFVVIDPFDHPHLGNPALPAPDYALKPYAFTGQCVETNVPSSTTGNVKTLNPDLYHGVLFLFLEGEVKAYYRWSTYTAHRWENPSEKMPDEVSSAKGNVHYDFQSHVAASVENINYGFWIYKPGDSDKKTDGRFYFQDPVPTSLDPDGKTQVMVHIGYSVDVENIEKNYNGSGGCIVSPSFPRLRRLVAELYLADPSPAKKNLYPFLKSTHASCKAMWARSEGSGGPLLGNYLASIYDPDVYNSNEWEGTITGGCWIVRPDEPTTR